MKWLRLLRLVRLRRTLLDAYRLLREPLVPLPLKLTALGLVVLILSPLNVLGDIPLLGIVDDVALIGPRRRMVRGRRSPGARGRHVRRRGVCAGRPLDAHGVSRVYL
jgi:uncharacterized membrane protein YkvA (DUF1232 family)